MNHPNDLSIYYAVQHIHDEEQMVEMVNVVKEMKKVVMMMDDDQ